MNLSSVAESVKQKPINASLDHSHSTASEPALQKVEKTLENHDNKHQKTAGDPVQSLNSSAKAKTCENESRAGDNGKGHVESSGANGNSVHTETSSAPEKADKKADHDKNDGDNDVVIIADDGCESHVITAEAAATNPSTGPQESKHNLNNSTPTAPVTTSDTQSKVTSAQSCKDQKKTTLAISSAEKEGRPQTPVQTEQKEPARSHLIALSEEEGGEDDEEDDDDDDDDDDEEEEEETRAAYSAQDSELKKRKASTLSEQDNAVVSGDDAATMSPERSIAKSQPDASHSTVVKTENASPKRKIARKIRHETDILIGRGENQQRRILIF